MTKFIKGQKLPASSICAHNCIFTGTVLSHTTKTLPLKAEGQTKRVKIHTRDNQGYIYPFGRYSVAPMFKRYDKYEHIQHPIVTEA